MAQQVSDIILTPVQVFYAPVGTAIPADTVAVDAAWPTGWVKLGYTNDPLKMSYTFDVVEAEVQESMTAVARKKAKEKVSLETTLAQLSLDQLQLAFAGAVTNQAASSGVPGKEEMDLGGSSSLPIKMWGFEGSYTDDSGNTFPIRAFVWKATSASGGDLSFGTDKYVNFPLKIDALADMSKAKGQRLCKIQRINAVAL